MNIALRLLSLTCLPLLGGLPLLAQAQNYDPPERVARLSYVRGDVAMAPGGSDNWSAADLNRPLLSGDRLYAGEDSRAVLEMDEASLRVDDGSALDLVAMDDDRLQIQLTQGTVNLAVRRMDRGRTYEIDTPTLAFVADRPGSYRIDIDPDGYGAMVTVFDGAGTAWGERNSQRSLGPGRSYRFDDADVDRVRISAIPGHNDFDRFCDDLDHRYVDSISARYVADDVIGYSDLDRYGSWSQTAEYGHVWFPSHVAADWAPYRHGRWAWIEPWGWTWIDSSPWGFAPFHYGRWARVHHRWGWVPGPRLHRAVFAPALVAFVGNTRFAIGSSAPVGWFPLGPRDIYQPPYRVSENYFININLGGGRFFHRNHVRQRWDDYHRHRDMQRFDYAYRHDRDAVTVVSRDTFRDSRLVSRSDARLHEAVLQGSHIESAPSVQPNTASRVAGRSHRPPQGHAFNRRVIARGGALAETAHANTARTAARAPRGTPARAISEAPERTAARSLPPHERNRDPHVTAVPRSMIHAPASSPRGLPQRAIQRNATPTAVIRHAQPQTRTRTLPQAARVTHRAVPVRRAPVMSTTATRSRATAEPVRRMPPAATVQRTMPRSAPRPAPRRAAVSTPAPREHTVSRSSSRRASTSTHDNNSNRTSSPRGRPGGAALSGRR